MCACRATYGLLALIVLLSTAAGERTEPGPAVCHPDCAKWGNCGEDGHCRCPFGRVGAVCELDLLAPCRQLAGGDALCGAVSTKSCECIKRCYEFFSLKSLWGREMINGWPPPRDRACYRWEGAPLDEQYSRIPEPEEESKVKCFKNYMDNTTEIPCSEAMVWGNNVNLPLSRCPNKCSNKGYCLKDAGAPADQPGRCVCYRSYWGTSCENTENQCYNQCSGRGTCMDQFCHCQPPYFSLGCTRSKVYPPNHSQPSPINFKIYMYELSTQLVYNIAEFLNFFPDFIYIAHQKFLEQFLTSSVRTEDPSEANLFFIPAMTFSYTGNGGGGTEHLHLIINHIRRQYPYWNRTGGRDHFFWSTTDRGGCELDLEGLNAIKVVHFGMYTTPERHSPSFPHFGQKEYGCTHPLRDVVATPYTTDSVEKWMPNTLKLTLDELLQMKKRYLFFAGGVLDGQPEYSGNSRQTLFRAVKEWNDPEFQMVEGGVGEEYQDLLRTSKFCFAPYGWGFGMRLGQTMLAGCVPIIVQEYNMQAYEDQLPYETFSLRLSNADLPHLREILRGITDEQYCQLLQGVLRHLPAFSWNPGLGGRAFDYTIASLRRRYLNFKALYYGTYYNDTAGG